MKFISSLSSKSSIKRRSPPGPGIRRERMWQFALLALLAAYLLVFSIINFCGFTDFMTPDIYSDTLAARYMWEQKSLFPEGWVFGNQYYVVATPVLSALFYGLIGSMNLAMAIATTVMTLALLAACYWNYEDLFQSVGYIYPQDLRGPEDNDRAVYLIPDKHLEEARRQAQEKSAELTLVRQFETMALYTSSVQLMRPVI